MNTATSQIKETVVPELMPRYVQRIDENGHYVILKEKRANTGFNRSYPHEYVFHDGDILTSYEYDERIHIEFVIKNLENATSHEKIITFLEAETKERLLHAFSWGLNALRIGHLNRKCSKKFIVQQLAKGIVEWQKELDNARNHQNNIIIDADVTDIPEKLALPVSIQHNEQPTTSQHVDFPEEKTETVQDCHALSLIANSELNISDDWNKLDYMTNIDCELWCIQHDKIAERNNTLRIQNCKTPEQAKALLDSGSGETLCLIATKIHAHYQDNWRDYHLRASILARLFPDNAELQNEFNSLITIPILRDVMIPPQNISKGYSVYRRANEEYHENARFNKKIIDQCVTRQDILNVLRSISGASIYCQAQYDRLKGVPSAIPVDKSLSHEQEKVVIHDELAALYADALIARRERKLRSKRKVIQKEKTSETQESWGEVAHELADPVQQLEALPATASQPAKSEDKPQTPIATHEPERQNAPKRTRTTRKRAQFTVEDIRACSDENQVLALLEGLSLNELKSWAKSLKIRLGHLKGMNNKAKLSKHIAFTVIYEKELREIYAKKRIVKTGTRVTTLTEHYYSMDEKTGQISFVFC